MTERNIAAPIVNPETAHFWEAAQEEKMLLKRCNSCGEAHHYPRTICPFCFSDDTAWEEASGDGVIYSFSIVRQASPQYVLAYVTLKEGPTVLTNIVTDQVDALKIGDSVKVTFQPSGSGQPVPMFKVV